MRTYLECYRVLEEVQRDLHALKAAGITSATGLPEITPQSGAFPVATGSGLQGLQADPQDKRWIVARGTKQWKPTRLANALRTIRSLAWGNLQTITLTAVFVERKRRVKKSGPNAADEGRAKRVPSGRLLGPSSE